MKNGKKSIQKSKITGAYWTIQLFNFQWKNIGVKRTFLRSKKTTYGLTVVWVGIHRAYCAEIFYWIYEIAIYSRALLLDLPLRIDFIY
jgi:hypothetical protein